MPLFASKQLLERHIRHMHSEVPPPRVPCTKCPKTFSRQDAMERHARKCNGMSNAEKARLRKEKRENEKLAKAAKAAAAKNSRRGGARNAKGGAKAPKKGRRDDYNDTGALGMGRANAQAGPSHLHF